MSLQEKYPELFSYNPPMVDTFPTDYLKRPVKIAI
jgi:hypothetical protein